MEWKGVICSTNKRHVWCIWFILRQKCDCVYLALILLAQCSFKVSLLWSYLIFTLHEFTVIWNYILCSESTHTHKHVTEVTINVKQKANFWVILKIIIQVKNISYLACREMTDETNTMYKMCNCILSKQKLIENEAGCSSLSSLSLRLSLQVWNTGRCCCCCCIIQNVRKCLCGAWSLFYAHMHASGITEEYLKRQLCF